MKNFTRSSFLIINVFLIGTFGCQKLKSPNPTTKTTSTNVNPVIAATVCDYDFDETSLTSSGWTKTFDDEFTGDLSNWYAFTGGVTNELEYNQPANAQVVGGVLQISAKQESVSGYNYTSASIVTNSTISANSTTPKVRVVARVKVASGYGLVSVFDSYGAAPWPTNGQINYFQVEGNDTKQYETNYFYGSQASQNQVNNGFYKDPADEDLSTCWHVFMTEWTQNSLNYYLDGKLVESKTGGYVPSLFGKSQNIALSLPIGGLYYENLVPANIQTGTMYVDYVKVFTSK